MAALVAVLLLAGPVSAGFQVFITVDENGNGQLNNTSGFSARMTSYFAADPGPGGLGSVLTYDLINPPGLVSGDVLLQDPNGETLDVVRFNATEVNPNGRVGSLLFYSDNTDGFDSGADTSSPPGSFYTNTITIPEVGSEENNGAIYTPTAGQPGFVAGAAGPVTYHLISDVSVPEPGSLTILSLALATFGAFVWKKRRTSKAAAV